MKLFHSISVHYQGNHCPKPMPDVYHKPFRPKSCVDYYVPGKSTCGIYRLFDEHGNSYPAYCDFKSEPGTAWTLVMSWANINRGLPEFRQTPFKYDAPINENSHNWYMYRQSLKRIRSLAAHSTHWRATCNYPSHGVDFTDYVRGNFKDFDIVNFLGSGVCKKVEHVNIRGHIGTHLTARFWQVNDTFTLHIDSGSGGCDFDPRAGSVSSEDNFGFYLVINPKFRCTKRKFSTTQWWFGAHL